MCGSGTCVGLNVFKPTGKIEVSESEPGRFEGRVTVQLSPKGWIKKGIHAFHGVAKVEKTAQIVNECFHLFQAALKSYARSEVYDFCKSIHDGAHALDEALHSIIIINDFLSIANGTFIERSEAPSIDFLKTASRICHFAAHLIASASFLAQLKILGKLDSWIITCGSLLHALGYALYGTALIWRHFNLNQPNRKVGADLSIQGSGLLIECLDLAKEWGLFSQTSLHHLRHFRSTAIIVQSLFILNRLKSPNHFHFSQDLNLPNPA
ncbi:MAG: hypothetical protein H0V82_01525 [Candidatus Protochlamydia sp.]|nr:hypothetical protein [Candidatus Protochlamydia sp.]